MNVSARPTCPFCDEVFPADKMGWRDFVEHLAHRCKADARVAGRRLYYFDRHTVICWCGRNVHRDQLRHHFDHFARVAGHVLQLALAYDPDAIPF